jgi:hypothetical protein
MILYLPPVHNFVPGESNRQPMDSAGNRDFTPNHCLTSVGITVPHHFGIGNVFGEAPSRDINYCRNDNANPHVKYFPQRDPLGS